MLRVVLRRGGERARCIGRRIACGSTVEGAVRFATKRQRRREYPPWGEGIELVGLAWGGALWSHGTILRKAFQEMVNLFEGEAIV